MTPTHWGDPLARALGILLDGRAQPTGIKKRGAEVTLFLALNAYEGNIQFQLPRVVGGNHWRYLADTNRIDSPAPAPLRAGSAFEAAGRTLVLFELVPIMPDQSME